LSIKLNTQYLSGAQVDSAFAIWTIENQQPQRIKMTVQNDSLLAGMKLFNEGAGRLVIHIFSNKKYRNQYYGQWLSEVSVALKKDKPKSYNGPTGFFDAGWFPRVDLKDGIGHRAIIALRPDDPYFIIKDPGHAVKELVIERGYWKTVGGVQLAGSAVYKCRNACLGVENTTYFTTLPGRIGTTPWNHISIYILFDSFENGGGGGYAWGLELEYDL
jgi:hypothetical protein